MLSAMLSTRSAQVASVLRHFDVVGLTERFDESLAVLGHATGMRHLGYARLAANNKPRHPQLAKRVLEGVLADAGVRSSKQPTPTVTPSLVQSFETPLGAGGWALGIRHEHDQQASDRGDPQLLAGRPAGYRLSEAPHSYRRL